MIISKIDSTDYIYYNLHAEQVIRSNYTSPNKSILGIYENQLENQVLLDIQNDLKENDITKNIILDFNYIDSFVILNAFDTIKNINEEIRQSGKKLFLLYIKEELIPPNTIGSENSGNNLIEKPQSNGEKKRSYSRYCMFEEAYDFEMYPLDAKKIFNDKFLIEIQEFVITDLKKIDQVHISSSVYLNSYIDVKQFILSQKDFSIYVIYRLGLKIREKILRLNAGDFMKKSENKALVCVSLVSAYIVSILSTLLKLDVLIFDKIGPIDSLYPRAESMINNEKEYIVVSDLVCIGTEVKIVKNILKYFGASYLGSASIIKVATINWDDIKKLRDDNKMGKNDVTQAVFIIDKSNNKELKYDIKTDLQNI